MSQKKIIELRPDSKLLKSNFDGYKLSLEPIPILRLENVPIPNRISPNLSAGEYSEKHSSLFQLHNHLIADPWLSNTAYYFDVTSSIQKIHYDVSVSSVSRELQQLLTKTSSTGFNRKAQSTSSSLQAIIQEAFIRWRHLQQRNQVRV
jgi:hypothetical protein